MHAALIGCGPSVLAFLISAFPSSVDGPWGWLKDGVIERIKAQPAISEKDASTYYVLEDPNHPNQRRGWVFLNRDGISIDPYFHCRAGEIFRLADGRRLRVSGGPDHADRYLAEALPVGELEKQIQRISARARNIGEQDLGAFVALYFHWFHRYLDQGEGWTLGELSEAKAYTGVSNPGGTVYTVLDAGKNCNRCRRFRIFQKVSSPTGSPMLVEFELRLYGNHNQVLYLSNGTKLSVEGGPDFSDRTVVVSPQ